ncbi:hypothetical protein LTR70_002873 [Exophiala xenobiotica]|nr:hypothetical protein LTR70_002873 [Exophiala xenobiotica]
MPDPLHLGAGTDIETDRDTESLDESEAELNTGAHTSSGLRSVGTLEDARWRQCCRQVLSAHIKSQTGLPVAPGHVRLLPRADDLYDRQYPAEKACLFQKPLHQVGADGGHDQPAPSLGIASELVKHLMDDLARVRSQRRLVEAKLVSTEDVLANKEREVQQLKSTLQHRNAQAHQASKLMAWHERRREMTDGGLQTIRNGLVA